MRQVSSYLDGDNQPVFVKCPWCDRQVQATWYTFNDLDLLGKEDMIATGHIEEIFICGCGGTSLLDLSIATGLVNLDPIPTEQVHNAGRSFTDQYSN